MDVDKNFKEYRVSCRYIVDTIPVKQLREQLKYEIARGIEDDLIEWGYTVPTKTPVPAKYLIPNYIQEEYQMDATITIAKPGFLKEMQSSNKQFNRLAEWEEDLQKREKKFKALKKDLLEINRLTKNVNELFRKTP